MENLFNINFSPVEITAATTTSRVALPTRSAKNILIDNSYQGAVDCFIKSGYITVTAALTDAHIAAGEKAAYAIDQDHTHVAAITSSGTTVVRITKGSGI